MSQGVSSTGAARPGANRPSGGVNIQGFGGNLTLEPGNILVGGTATSIVITDDNMTNATVYPVWVTGTPGEQAEYTSSMELTYNPATGVMSSLTFSGFFMGTTTTQPPLTDNQTLASTAYVDDAIAAAGDVQWYEVTGPTTMLINAGYVANNSSLVVLTLPPVAPFGARVRVAGKGAGGWQIAQAAGQIIHFGTQNTTSGSAGSVQSQSTFDTIELLCTTANTNWTALTAQGNISVS